MNTINPIRPGLFSRSSGRGLRGDQRPRCQKSILILTEIKFGMGDYGHKSIPDAKFESSSSFSFGDMTSQKFPRKKRISHQIRLFTPENV